MVLPGLGALIERKLQPPRLPQHLVDRARLAAQILELAASHRVVVVLGPPGSGKTTAVAAALAASDSHAAWLTLDETDREPLRLLTYIEGAIAQAAPNAAGTTAQSLDAGLQPAEAVGLLAEAIGDSPLTLVVDEMERLTTADAVALLDALIRNAPASLHLVLISDRQLPIDLVPLQLDGEVAIVDQADLGFTADEAAAALQARGATGVDLHRAMDATGGWIAGVLLHALQTEAETRGAADPLHEYLGGHVLSRLADLDREFLVSTCVLRDVTAARAQALGEAAAGERLASLRRFQLPIEWDMTGSALRCRPCLRAYLEQLLDQRPRSEVSRLRTTARELMPSETPEPAAPPMPATRTEARHEGADGDPIVHFAEFGHPKLHVDGEHVQPRIKKSYELLAYLTSKPVFEADRDELLDALFNGRADESARSYLRQAAHRLREALPAGATLAFSDNKLRLSGTIIVSDSARAEKLMREASAITEPEKLQLLVDALAIVDQGEYLAGINSAWVDERRQELAEMTARAQHDAAELLFADAEYAAAKRLVLSVLRRDPYRETGWRLLMRIARAAEDENGVINAYRACEQALSEIGTTPSPTTQSLLTTLRS